MTSATHPTARFRRPFGARRGDAETFRPLEGASDSAPIVVAVDNSPSAAAATEAAVDLAQEVGASLVFVFVGRGPSSALGEPYYQRRLETEMRTGRQALDRALAVAAREGAPATGEQLAGNPARRVVEFARMRGAQLVVLGSRRRRLRRSVSRDVIRSADRPVLIAAPTQPVAA